MTTAAIARRRMLSQRLWATPAASPGEVVAHFAAMQAQEFAIARWSVAQRGKGLDDAAVLAAFDAGEILRTHAHRGTWHFVARDDLRWVLAAVAERVHREARQHYRRFGLDDPKVATAVKRVVRRAVADGPATRKEIGSALARAGHEASGVGLGFVMMLAELDGVVCSGPLRGKQHTYADVDDRAPDAVRLDPEDARAELATRYFVSHGPATVRDLSLWSSLTVAQARRAVEAGGALASEEIDGRTYWFAAAGPSPWAVPRAPRIDLVQVYDETVMGYRDTRDVLLPDGVTTPWAAGGRVLHAILLDGRLAGHWRPAPTGDGVTVEAIPLPGHRLDRAALGNAAERFGRHLGLPASVDVAGAG